MSTILRSVFGSEYVEKLNPATLNAFIALDFEFERDDFLEALRLAALQAKDKRHPGYVAEILRRKEKQRKLGIPAKHAVVDDGPPASAETVRAEMKKINAILYRK